MIQLHFYQFSIHNSRLFRLTAWMVATGLCLITAFQSVGWEQSVVSNTVERGISGVLEFTYSGKPLHVKPQRQVDSPLSVRLQPTTNGVAQYRARFIGVREGRFDLRDYLEHTDGTTASDLPLMPVQIVSMLPNDRRSDLFDATVYRPRFTSGYRIALIIGGIIWLVIPGIVWAIRRWRTIPDAPARPVTPEPTTAEHLQILFGVARERPLTTGEKGRLELLMYQLWRERGALLQENMADSIGKLRTIPEVSELISSIEGWLHSRPGELTADQSQEAVLSRLTPIQAEWSAAHLNATGGLNLTDSKIGSSQQKSEPGEAT